MPGQRLSNLTNEKSNDHGRCKTHVQVTPRLSMCVESSKKTQTKQLLIFGLRMLEISWCDHEEWLHLRRRGCQALRSSSMKCLQVLMVIQIPSGRSLCEKMCRRYFCLILEFDLVEPKIDTFSRKQSVHFEFEWQCRLYLITMKKEACLHNSSVGDAFTIDDHIDWNRAIWGRK